MRPTISGEIARSLVDSESLLDASRKIARETIESLGSPIVAVFRDRAMGGSSADSLRVLSSWSPSTGEERLARSLLLLSAYRAEQSSPSAGYLFLQAVSGKKFPSSSPRVLLEHDLASLVSGVNDETIASLLVESIKQSGSVGNVSVSTGGITHIAVDDSCSYPIIVSPSFREAFKLTSRRIVVFDGIIESIGQINAFLENCSADKAQILLIARAFSTDVASTIHANNQRGVFDIVPATPGVGIEDEFTISDIGRIVGQKSLTSISYDSSSTCYDVIIERGNLKIHLGESLGREELLRLLRAESSQFKDTDVLKMLNRRVARTSTRRVSVCIGEEFGDLREIAKERFDYGMRCFLFARRRGVIEIDGSLYPSDSLASAVSTCESFKKLLKNTGGALVIDKTVEVAKRGESKDRRSRNSHSRQGSTALRRV